jgi:hypothetical protein
VARTGLESSSDIANTQLIDSSASPRWFHDFYRTKTVQTAEHFSILKPVVVE